MHAAFKTSRAEASREERDSGTRLAARECGEHVDAPALFTSAVASAIYAFAREDVFPHPGASTLCVSTRVSRAESSASTCPFLK